MFMSRMGSGLHNFDDDVNIVAVHFGTSLRWESNRLCMYGSHKAPLNGRSVINVCICTHLVLVVWTLNSEAKIMTHVRYISTSTVQSAASPNELTRRIELTPWDLQLLLVDHIQKGILFFKPTPSQEKELKGSSVIDHLKTSVPHIRYILPPCRSPCHGRKRWWQNQLFLCWLQ